MKLASSFTCRCTAHQNGGLPMVFPLPPPGSEWPAHFFGWLFVGFGDDNEMGMSRTASSFRALRMLSRRLPSSALTATP